MKEFVVDHEVTIESTLSYFFGAKNIIKGYEKSFDVAFLSSGNYLYNGLIQSATYQGLKNKRKMILFFTGRKDDKIIVYNKAIGPYLGKIWKLNSDFKNDYSFITFEEYGLEYINNQLNNLRILFDLDVIVPVFLGSKTKTSDFLEFVSNFDVKSDYNFVFISDSALKFDINNSETILSQDGKNLLNQNFIKNDIVYVNFMAYVKSFELDIKILSQEEAYNISEKDDENGIYLSILAK